MESTPEFDKTLGQVKELFLKKIDAVTNYTAKVQKICSTALAASLPVIRHTPITSRIKSWKSAQGSIRRRHAEYLQTKRLREHVERCGQVWDDYSQEMGLGSWNDNLTSSHNPKELLDALHDFGGIRISLYFPGDLEKVADILDKHFDVFRRTEKGDESQVNIQTMKNRLGLTEDPDEGKQELSAANALKKPIRTFKGYKATHFIVKLRNKDMEEDFEIAWEDVVVEIQVGTLVMHVWSEIEHDMIYKPLDSQGAGVSEDEERILDLINGIVLTGEAALRQLEASTAKRLNLRAKYKEMTACSHYEIATWIERDCKELKIDLQGDAKWALLEQLFTILKATGHHKHADVTGLIKRAAQKTSSRHLMPAKMLKLLCQTIVDSKWRPLGIDDHLCLIKNARLWALRLVHSLNVAIYLGVAQEFITERTPPCRPSINAFLDILHPYQPRCLDHGIADMITKFCKAVLEDDIDLKSNVNELVQVARALPARNLVTSLPGAEVSEIVPIPVILYRLLCDDVANEDSHIEDVYRSLEIIDLIMVRSEKKHESSVNLARLLGWTADSEDRFFVPIDVTGSMPKSRWQLSKDSLHLVIQSADLAETHQFALLPQLGESNGESSLEEGNGTSSSVLNLAYHLYPQEQWKDVYRAWQLVKDFQLDQKQETPQNDVRSVINEGLRASLRLQAGFSWGESSKEDTKLDLNTKGEMKRFPSNPPDLKSVFDGLISRGQQPQVNNLSRVQRMIPSFSSSRTTP